MRRKGTRHRAVAMVVSRPSGVRLAVVKGRRPPNYTCRFTSAYRSPMGDSGENWGAYLRRMTSRPGWSVARLARESSIHRATIFGWIKEGTPKVNVESVRAIAQALGDDIGVALRAAGRVEGEPTDADEREIAEIERSDISRQLKDRLIAHVRARQERDRLARMEEVRMIAEAAGEDIPDR